MGKRLPKKKKPKKRSKKESGKKGAAGDANTLTVLVLVLLLTSPLPLTAFSRPVTLMASNTALKSTAASVSMPEMLTSTTPGTWAHTTMTTRIDSTILEKILTDNPSVTTDEAFMRRFAELRKELREDAVLTPTGHGKFDSIIGDLREGSNTYLTAPWLVSEFYVYRRVMDALGYYSNDSPHFHFDPFLVEKRRGLDSAINDGVFSRVVSAANAIADTREGLKFCIMSSLWGNKIDLSIWNVGSGEGQNGTGGDENCLLTDDSDKALDFLLPSTADSEGNGSGSGSSSGSGSGSGSVDSGESLITLTAFLKMVNLGSGGEIGKIITDGRVLLNGKVETRKRKQLYAGDVLTFEESEESFDVEEVLDAVGGDGGKHRQQRMKRMQRRQKKLHIVVDNAGFELSTDLLLANFLLERNVVEEVVFQAKAHPTFVSDAIVSDVWEHIEKFADRGNGDDALVQLGESLLEYKSSGRLTVVDDMFWNLPLRMDKAPKHLREDLDGRLVIYKGDANYRRLIEDRPFALDKPLRECVGDLASQCHVLALRCLKAELGCGMNMERVSAAKRTEGWRTCGKFGVVQFLKRSNK